MTREIRVGDKLRYNEYSTYLTQGKVYVVVNVNEDGEPLVYDDDGDDERIFAHELESTRWTLAENPEMYTSTIESSYGITTLTVMVNEQGLRELEELKDSINKRAELAELYSQLAEIQRKIKEAEAK